MIDFKPCLCLTKLSFELIKPRASVHYSLVITSQPSRVCIKPIWLWQILERVALVVFVLCELNVGPGSKPVPVEIEVSLFCRFQYFDTMSIAARAIPGGREAASADRRNDADVAVDDVHSHDDDDDDDDNERTDVFKIYVGNLPNSITVERLTK